VKKELSDRVHECTYCGFSCDRDYNASRNILIAGMEQPVAPIESKPLHHISVMQVLAMSGKPCPLGRGSSLESQLQDNLLGSSRAGKVSAQGQQAPTVKFSTGE